MQEETTKVEEITTDEEVTEEQHEDDSTDEGEDASEVESSESDSSEKSTESADAKRARLTRQASREAKKLGITLEEYLGKESSKKDSQESGEESRKEKVADTSKEDVRYLKTQGYTTKKEQDVIFDYAALKGVEIDDIIDNPKKYPIPHAEVKALRDQASTPAPSTRTSKGANNSIDALLSRYKAGKYLTPEEMRQVRKHTRR